MAIAALHAAASVASAPRLAVRRDGNPYPFVRLLRAGAAAAALVGAPLAAMPVRPGSDLVAVLGTIWRRLRPWSAAWEREPEDRPLDTAELLPERAGVVRELVALTDLLDPRSDLRVAAAGHVRKEVVLHLVAEVAARDVEERAPLDVGRAHELAHVPATAVLVLDLLLGERVRLVREVAAEDDRVRPHVPNDVGSGVGLGRAPKRLRCASERPLGR